MSRWICIDNICIPSDENDWDELVAFADAVAEQEPIDLVRCGECKLNETDDCPMVYYTPLEDGGIETRWWNRPDDFCSWGERRTNDNDYTSDMVCHSSDYMAGNLCG